MDGSHRHRFKLEFAWVGLQVPSDAARAGSLYHPSGAERGVPRRIVQGEADLERGRFQDFFHPSIGAVELRGRRKAQYKLWLQRLWKEDEEQMLGLPE